ncbi:MAG: hypothetical protein ABI609_11540 [Acidobacteriota bacterium]
MVGTKVRRRVSGGLVWTLAALAAGASAAAPPSLEKASTEPATVESGPGASVATVWQALATLEGTWDGWSEGEGGPKIDAHWTATSGGSVLVETNWPEIPQKKEEFFFSRAGDDLVVEFFGSLGNGRAIYDRATSLSNRWAFKSVPGDPKAPQTSPLQLVGVIKLYDDGKLFEDWKLNSGERTLDHRRLFVGKRRPPVVATAQTADVVWKGLVTLAGSWKGWSEGEGGPKIQVTWAPTATGTALIETDWPGTAKEEKIVYSRSGDDLVAEYFGTRGFGRATLDVAGSRRDYWAFRGAPDDPLALAPHSTKGLFQGVIRLHDDGKVVEDWMFIEGSRMLQHWRQYITKD